MQKWYPLGITGFHGLPGDVIPRYACKRYEWRIGETTDDTEQTLAVARALLREGDVSHAAIGRELLKCKKSLHPGVSMWTFVQIGDPVRSVQCLVSEALRPVHFSANEFIPPERSGYKPLH